MAGNRSKVLRAWLLVILCVALIWTLSGENFAAPSTSRFLTPLLRWLYPEISWRAIVRVHFFVRKSAHLTEYAILAMLAFRALRLSLDVSALRVTGLALALVIVVAAVDELRQSFVAARTGSLGDVVINLAGGTLGVALIVTFHRWLGIGAPAAEKEP